MSAKVQFIWPETADPLLIEEVEAYIREQNLPGMIISRPLSPPEPGSMSAGEWLPVIQAVLGSTAAAAAVKGLFDLIKKAIDLRMHRLSLQADLEKARIAQSPVSFILEKPSGEKVSFQFSTMDEAERHQRFSEFIQRAWEEKV